MARHGPLNPLRIDFALNHNVSAGFQSKWTALWIDFGTPKSAFDVAWTRIVPLDEVRIVTVHHADKVRQLLRGVRMQPLPKRAGSSLELHRQIGDPVRHAILEEARLNPFRRLQHLPIL